jgi:NADH dehydrogenase
MQQQELKFQREGSDTAKRVLILGAGFAGLTAAKTIGSKLSQEAIASGKIEVLLVNRRNYHLFTPLLYQASTGMVDVDAIAQPIRPQARKSGFSFLEADVKSINVQSQVVYTEDRSLSYDYLVIALGSVKESILKGDTETAIPLKTLQDGMRIHNRIVESFEKGATINPGPERNEFLNFVIIGGSTGAELAGSVIDYVKDVAKDYPEVDFERDCNVYLIEAGERLFPTHDKVLSNIVKNSLQRRGVKVVLDTKVEKIEDKNKVILSNGKMIKAWNIFDNTGIRPNPVLDTMPDDVVKKEKGKIVVDLNLRLPDFPNVFAIGDNSEVVIGRTEKGRARHAPPTAESAVEEGKYVGKLIAAELNNYLKTGEMNHIRGVPFHYKEKGTMLSIGSRTGIAKFPWFTFTGFTGWLIWRVVHLYLLATARSQFAVAFDWVLDSFSGRNITQLDNVNQKS